MKLDGLMALYKNMIRENIDSAKFQYVVRDIMFDVFFSIENKPFELLFGHLGKEYVAFTITVENGFNINPIIDNDIYKSLCRLFRTTGTSLNTLKMSEFFSEFNKKIPHSPKKHKISDKAQYVRNVDEAEKIYFCGWLRNDKEKGRGVSAQNLEKTRKLLNKAYAFCKTHNVSSCWSDIPADERVYFEPPGS